MRCFVKSEINMLTYMLITTFYRIVLGPGEHYSWFVDRHVGTWHTTDEPCCSNMADDEQAIVFACTSE